MKLLNVWVVEGGSSPAIGQFAPFELRVEPAGWTLTDAEEPTVERLWSWDTIGSLEVVRGAGKTPDGRPATALNVIVNGWPVRVLVPAADLPNETLAMLGAFAPIGHPLRSNVRVSHESAARRFSDAGRRFVAERRRAGPVFLLSAASTRLRSALVVGLVLVVTVVAASIAGVATSAQAPHKAASTATSGAPPTTEHPGMVTDPAAATSSTAPAATSSSTPASTSTPSSTVAGSKGAAKGKVTRVVTRKPATAASGSTKSTSVSTRPPSTTSPPTTRPTSPTTPTTAPATTVAPTTTTTRPRRSPTTTTTRPRRPPTTTAPPTTQPPPTTTQASATTGVVSIPVP